MNRSSLTLALTVVMGANAAYGQVPFAAQTYQFTGGRLAIGLPANHKLKNVPLATNIQSTASPTTELETNAGFAVNARATSLQLAGQDFRLDRFSEGTVQLSGTFQLQVGKKIAVFKDPIIRPTAESPKSRLEIVGRDPKTGAELTLDVVATLGVFEPEMNRLRLTAGDLKVSPSLAKFFGDPSLRGEMLGAFSLECGIQQISGPSLPEREPDEDPDERALYDVGVCRINGFTRVGTADRTGTFPTGVVALSTSTTSTNYAGTNVPWFAASTTIGTVMNPNHPVIAQNFFRIENGKFEQIGESWVKHGFLATNTTECYSSPLAGISPGGGCSGSGGTSLKPGCNDTYGVSLNASRSYMGPKNEVNPRTGLWNPVGSYFAMGQPDAIRRRNGTQYVSNLATMATSSWTPGPVENRMPVAETDLDRPGAQFIYEAYYVSQDEINKYNQCVYRYTTVTKNTVSSRFDFVDTANYAQTVAIYAWPGATKVMSQPQLDGDAIMALKTTNLADGWVLYDYAVYVHDIDRELDAFYIPVDDSVAVQNITFRDTDKIGTNEWDISRSNGAIRWSMKGTPNNNSLSWGRVFNFRFEAQAVPGSSFAQGDLMKTGTFPFVTSVINGPTPSAKPVNGTLTIPGRGDVAPTAVDVRLTSLDGGDDTVVSGVAVNMPSGAYAASTVKRGRYTVAIQGAPFLRKASSTIVHIGPDGSTAPIDFTLITGDVDGSNDIDAADIDAVIAQFGSIVNGPWDVDGSGEVDAADIDLVISNFGSVGDL